MTDFVAGQIPIVSTTTSDLLEMHRAGRVRILATSGKERSPFVPEVPTFREAGYQIEGTGWYGIFAPAQTPVNSRAAKQSDSRGDGCDGFEREVARAWTGADGDRRRRVRRNPASQLRPLGAHRQGFGLQARPTLSLLQPGN